MPTIAFFKLSDFVREVKGGAQPGAQPVVRVEGLIKTINGNPSPAIRYEIWVTAAANGGVLAARILTGSTLEIFANEFPQLVPNHQKAERIVRERLRAAGFDVRAGIVEHSTELQAHGEGLWHFDKETKEMVEEVEIDAVSCAPQPERVTAVDHAAAQDDTALRKIAADHIATLKWIRREAPGGWCEAFERRYRMACDGAGLFAAYCSDCEEMTEHAAGAAGDVCVECGFVHEPAPF